MRIVFERHRNKGIPVVEPVHDAVVTQHKQRKQQRHVDVDQVVAPVQQEQENLNSGEGEDEDALGGENPSGALPFTAAEAAQGPTQPLPPELRPKSTETDGQPEGAGSNVPSVAGPHHRRTGAWEGKEIDSESDTKQSTQRKESCLILIISYASIINVIPRGSVLGLPFPHHLPTVLFHS